MFFEALHFPSVSHRQLCILEWLGVGAASHDCSPGIFFLFVSSLITGSVVRPMPLEAVW